MGTNRPIFDWLAERLSLSQVVRDGPGYPGVPDLSNWDLEPDDQGLVSRPEMGNFALAMVAGGKTSGAAHAFGKRETLDGLGSPHINAWVQISPGATWAMLSSSMSAAALVRTILLPILDQHQTLTGSGQAGFPFNFCRSIQDSASSYKTGLRTSNAVKRRFTRVTRPRRWLRAACNSWCTTFSSRTLSRMPTFTGCALFCEPLALHPRPRCQHQTG